MSIWAVIYGEPEGFGCYYNSAVFPYDKPKVVSYELGSYSAMVSYNGLTRVVEASFEVGLLRYGTKPEPDKLKVSGFAGRFRTGRVLWNASIEFQGRDGVWEYHQTYLFGVPHSKGPATIVGFLQDFPPKQKGTGGYREMIEDRARAGHADGPQNAAEVGRYWERIRKKE
jgi:hypothetical protein